MKTTTQLGGNFAPCVDVLDTGGITIRNLAGDHVGMSTDCADRLLEVLLERKQRRENDAIREGLKKVRLSFTVPKLSWKRDPEEEKVYRAVVDSGVFTITPVWSTVYNDKVNGYAVTFKPTGGEDVQIGSTDLGRKYLNGATDRKMGEKYFADAKSAAEAYNFANNSLVSK